MNLKCTWLLRNIFYWQRFTKDGCYVLICCISSQLEGTSLELLLIFSLLKLWCEYSVYALLYTSVLTWDPGCIWVETFSENMWHIFVFLPLYYSTVFLNRDWSLAFEIKVLTPVAMADIANRSQSSSLWMSAPLRLLLKSWPGRGLYCHLCAILRHVSHPSKIKEEAICAQKFLIQEIDLRSCLTHIHLFRGKSPISWWWLHHILICELY